MADLWIIYSSKHDFMLGPENQACKMNQAAIDAGIDSDKISDQEAFHMADGDTVDDVEEKIHAIEHVLYPSVLEKLCKEN